MSLGGVLRTTGPSPFTRIVLSSSSVGPLLSMTMGVGSVGIEDDVVLQHDLRAPGLAILPDRRPFRVEELAGADGRVAEDGEVPAVPDGDVRVA